MKSSSAGRALQSLAVVAAATFFAAPLSAQSGDCLDSDCFYDRQVRDFTVVDNDTVIIYVGHARCPFIVNVRGLFCDLKYLPDIQFFHARERRIDVVTGRRNPRQRGFIIPGETAFDSNERICTNNGSMYALETFGFGAALDEEEIGQGRAACRVLDVVKVTDDDLVELYALEGITPPPPPIGNGSISRSQDSTGTGEDTSETDR
ncbi:MAG: hypothetical protein PVF50_10090 [Gammaproteobacteria bacterium]|jgi:hypothetical protein